jgi:hypothetical protein
VLKKPRQRRFQHPGYKHFKPLRWHQQAEEGAGKPFSAAC